MSIVYKKCYKPGKNIMTGEKLHSESLGVLGYFSACFVKTIVKSQNKPKLTNPHLACFYCAV